MTKDLFYKIEMLEQYLSRKINVNKLVKLLDLSLRQVRRILKKYKQHGKISLIHGLNK